MILQLSFFLFAVCLIAPNFDFQFGEADEQNGTKFGANKKTAKKKKEGRKIEIVDLSSGRRSECQAAGLGSHDG